MKLQDTQITNYLTFCKTQKCLDEKTIRAYKIDLTQFLPLCLLKPLYTISLPDNWKPILHTSIPFTNPKPPKEKSHRSKAFFTIVNFMNLLRRIPLTKSRFVSGNPLFSETIPLQTLELFPLYDLLTQRQLATTPYQQKNALRDAAVIELLFATGIRISELCSLKPCDVNLNDNFVLIYGKGSKRTKTANWKR